MNELMNKKPDMRSRIITAVIAVFAVMSLLALFKYMNRDSLDEQIATAEKRNRELREKTIYGQVLIFKEMQEKEEERVKNVPIKLAENDELIAEIHDLIKEKNLDPEKIFSEYPEKSKLYADEIQKLADQDYAAEQKKRASKDMVAEKKKYLIKLNQENVTLMKESILEATVPEVREIHKKELKKYMEMRDERLVDFTEPDYETDMIIHLKNTLRYVKVLPANKKTDSDKNKSNSPRGDEQNE